MFLDFIHLPSLLLGAAGHLIWDVALVVGVYLVGRKFHHHRHGHCDCKCHQHEEA